MSQKQTSQKAQKQTSQPSQPNKFVDIVVNPFTKTLQITTHYTDRTHKYITIEPYDRVIVRVKEHEEIEYVIVIHNNKAKIYRNIRRFSDLIDTSYQIFSQAYCTCECK